MSCAINLMTPHACRREVYFKRLRQWRGILISLLTLLVMITAAHYYVVRQLNLEQQLLETTVEPINQLKDANRRLNKEIVAIRKKDQFLLLHSGRKPTVTLLGILGSAIEKVGDQVFLEKIALSYIPNSTEELEISTTILEIGGMAQNGDAANQVAEEMQKALPFGKLNVLGNNETHINNLMMNDFSMQFTF